MLDSENADMASVARFEQATLDQIARDDNAGCPTGWRIAFVPASDCIDDERVCCVLVDVANAYVLARSEPYASLDDVAGSVERVRAFVSTYLS